MAPGSARAYRGGLFEPPPHNEILGPIRPRGGPNGLILRGGAVVARWGDTRQVDFTFSAAKSYLSLLAGIAVDDGLISDIDEPVGHTVDDGGSTAHTTAPSRGVIGCQQTSEWGRGGLAVRQVDIIDRTRNLAMEGKGRKCDARPLQAPGTFWEYNDVRVNRLALALLRPGSVSACPKCSPTGSWARSAPRARGAGMATAHPWWRSAAG